MKKHIFYTFWLMLGFVQLGAVAVGQMPAQSEHLLSNTLESLSQKLELNSFKDPTAMLIS